VFVYVNFCLFDKYNKLYDQGIFFLILLKI
jgi:hypothetical protein